MKTISHPASTISELICSKCGKQYEKNQVQTFAVCCNVPLLSLYEPGRLSKEVLSGREYNMWRYFEMLPVIDSANIVSLGEGWTPLSEWKKLSDREEISILMKDEGNNPTGSFKARGISAAISKARELGIGQLVIPTAGNAGGALAAYCAQAGMKCIVVMPKHTPEVFKTECRLFGAELILVNGLINDCAREVMAIRSKKDYFDITTLKEPYRLEGKKTMGYEIAEQLNWKLPNAIIYPTGGGTGLIGIWKAFKEMVCLGWVQGPLPKMFAVEAENCAPLKMALADPTGWKDRFTPHPSLANGLAVPFPFAIDLMQEVIYESDGDVVTATEKEILDGIKEVAGYEGVLLSPEGSAAWTGLKKLLQTNHIKKGEQVLVLNTGSGYKCLDDLKDQLGNGSKA
jgi:threonine synthase